MGASEWMLFAPYQPDIEELIQAMREEAFRSGTYYNFAEYALEQLRNLDFEEYNPYEYHPRYRLSKAEFERLGALSNPETVEDLSRFRHPAGLTASLILTGCR